MKNNIFVKIKNKKRFSQALLYMCLLCGFLLFSCMSVYAYFTAKASEKGDISFGTIEVNLLDSSGNAMSATSMASQYLSNIVPGQQIQLSNINVKNSGTHDEYVLINLDIVIGEETGIPLKYNFWTNVFGEEVNINNFTINATKATIINPNNSVKTNIKWTVPGEALNSEYVGTSLRATIMAYGVQAYLPEAELYKDKALYASYFICKNVNEINVDNNISSNGNLNVVTEPLKAFTYKNLLNSADIKAITVDNNGTKGYGFKFENLNGKYVFSFSGTTAKSFYCKTIKNYTFGTNVVLTNGSVVSVNEGETLLIYANAAEDWDTISNIQFEKGESATSYEAFKTYADEINYTTAETTKNIDILVLNGTENWVNYSTSNLGQSFTLQFTDKQIGARTSKCSHFNNVESAWSATYINSKGIYADHTSESKFYFRAPNESINTVNLFKEYLANEYEKGTPVTIWYKLATPVTDNFYTSKNLYSGSQKLIYDTDSNITDTTNENATITITDAKLVKYLANKNFAISANVRLGELDKAKLSDGSYGFNVQITYINSTNGNKTSLRTYKLGKYDYNKNIFVWVNNQEILEEYSSEQLLNITAIEIQLRNVETSTYSSFEIKNIQLEIGASPTDYTMYDKTVYSYVNGVALRAVGEDRDTYSYNSSTGEGIITRNIALLDLATLNWSTTDNSAANGQFWARPNVDIVYPEAQHIISDFVCSEYLVASYTSYTSMDKIIYSANNTKLIYIRDTRYTDLTTFRNSIKGTLFVRLETSTTETI